MKVKIIVRSTSITGIVLFLGAIVVLSNPGNLHADGPVAQRMRTASAVA